MKLFRLPDLTLCLLLTVAFWPVIPAGSGQSCYPTRQIPIDRWRGEYFNNPDLNGSPAMFRDDGNGAINFNWGLSSPAAECGLKPDNFSVRWTRKEAFSEGIYLFTITSDDGARLLIDGREIFRDWRDHPPATVSIPVPMTSGNHTVVFEYYDRWGGAVAALKWKEHPCFARVPTDRWKGEYFNNPSLNGNPVAVRDDGDQFPGFTRLTNSPYRDCNVPADDFSVRWSRKAIFNSGRYRFIVTADDGARLFIDGKKLIDQWRDQPPATFTAELDMTAGIHLIVLEYYDHAGGATARLRWDLIGALGRERGIR